MREMMTAHLRGIGFVADGVGRGEDAITAAAAVAYDVIVLDLGLPDLDGVDVLRRLRADVARDVPVLVLTARDQISDRVSGLDAGADDYLLKPFDLEEFDARLRSVLRRPALRADPLLRLGDIALDVQAREARVGDCVLDLTRRELSLLEELIRSASRTVVRDTLEERLWGMSEPVSGNALEAAVSRLRRRLAQAGSICVVETIRGIGYRLAVGDRDR